MKDEEIVKEILDSLPVCKQATYLFHKMFHSVIENETICLESGRIHLDTEPACSAIIIIATCDSEHFNEVRMAGHEAITAKLEELYGPRKENKVQ